MSWRSQSGQALAEFVIGLIALAVLFLGIIFLADLCRARNKALLESRPEAGAVALSGLLMGSPTFYGGTDSSELLHSEVLAVTHDPVQYCDYRPGDYPYMTENLVSPIITSGDLIGTFGFVLSEKTYYVTNTAFLQRMNVGSSLIEVTQQTCIPQMKDFP